MILMKYVQMADRLLTEELDPTLADRLRSAQERMTAAAIEEAASYVAFKNVVREIAATGNERAARIATDTLWDLT